MIYLVDLLIAYTIGSISFVDDIIPITTVVISIAILGLGYKSYISFIRNRLSQKQLDIVSETIQLIHNSSIDFSFLHFENRGSHGRAVIANLFEIKSIYDPHHEILGFEDKSVIFDNNSNQIIDFVKIINNPITPKIIADELMNFHSSSYEIIDIEQLGTGVQDYIIINTKLFHPNRQLNTPQNDASYYQSNAFSMQTWLNFKTCCEKLEKVITDWLKFNGIKDINIRTEDFKSTFELPHQD